MAKDGKLLLEVDDASLCPSLPTALPFDRAKVSLYQVNRIHAETHSGLRQSPPAAAAGYSGLFGAQAHRRAIGER
jgi:hypothetical protein